MNENKRASEEIIRNEEDETSESFEEMMEEIEEVKNETLGSIEEPLEETPLPAKANKNEKAKYLVEKAKKIVKTINDREKACRLLLETGLDEYENAKSKLKTGGFDACVSLVKKLGSQTKNDLEAIISFESKEELKPIVIKDVSSGRFSALIYAMIGGFATAVGMVYLATKKLDMTLDLMKIPSEDVIQSILAWFSTLLGLYEDVYIGTAVLGVLVLLVMIFIYITRVRVKAKCNLHFAVKQFVEAELYIVNKADCKTEMEKIDMHIKDMVTIMRTCEMLLNEQKGKLERILYIEGERGKSTEYHYKSHREIHETTALIDTISEYMNIPLLEEGKLSEKSVVYLQNTKEQMNKMLERYY